MEGAVGNRGRVRFGDSSIEYNVLRSERRRKTVQITVDATGVQVAAPLDTPDCDVQSIVRKRAAWILRQTRPGTQAQAPRRFVSGETLPYLGRNVRLSVEENEALAPELRFDHWRFRVSVPAGLTEDERRRRTLRVVTDWYRSKAAQRLRAAVQSWWPRLGNGDEPRILIRDQRQRWGSCAPDGTLRFNWRVVMLEPSLIEYVVVHELAHLIVSNHSREFWRMMSSVMPDAEHRRRRLREAGKTLPL